MAKPRKSSSAARASHRRAAASSAKVPVARVSGQDARQARPARKDRKLAALSPRSSRWRAEAEQLRFRLVQMQTQLEASQRRQQWLHSALATERYSRFLLEASMPEDALDTAARIRGAVSATTPAGATVLVVSKGDPELLRLVGRQGWHFPRSDDGQYAGYHPADCSDAIQHLHKSMAEGAQFLLFPRSAFWWLEHYHGLRDHLEQQHVRVWRDEQCAIYRLVPSTLAEGSVAEAQGTPQSVRTERKGVLAAPKVGDRYDVVCFPIIEWGFRFQRPQQLMTQFAAAGHRVFYISQEFRASGGPYRLRELGRNLSEVCLRGPRINVFHSILDDTSRETLLVSLDALRRDQQIGPAAAIVQLPFWWPLARRAASSFGWPVIYDCMDHHAGFATSHPLILEQEQELLARADLVVASSDVLEAEARKHNRNVLLLRNACDYDHFAKVPPKSRGARPVIGYYGAIAEWFDSDLVADLAERRPDWEFILVGSTLGADIRRLSKLPNVSLPGEKPYAEIPSWLARFDVTILPFKRTALTEATNPVKAYEIFASGKPLVSVPLPESVLMVPLVRLASTAAEFERAIENELRRPDANLESARRAFATENTWQKRFEALGPEIDKVFQKTRIADGTGAVAKHSRYAESRKGNSEPRTPTASRDQCYERGLH
jgi:Glycosyl transferases group 1